MVSAILIDGNKKQIRLIKQVSNAFFVDRAYQESSAELTISIKNKRDNTKLHTVKVVHLFGDGINRLFVVDKVTTDNTKTFLKITYDLFGIEYLFNRREALEQKILEEEPLNPMEVSKSLIEWVQEDPDRHFNQIIDEITIDGELDKSDIWEIVEGQNIWDYISSQMEGFKFCCDTITTSFGIARIHFRVPKDNPGIIISDLSRNTKLQYVNTDYSEVKTFVMVGGEGEGNRRKFGFADTLATGIDRFESFQDESEMSSNDGYISNADYYTMINKQADQALKPVTTETDYIVPEQLYKKVKTGDTVYTSSAMVNNGVLEPRVVEELKFEIVDGVKRRSITFKEREKEEVANG